MKLLPKRLFPVGRLADESLIYHRGRRALRAALFGSVIVVMLALHVVHRPPSLGGNSTHHEGAAIDADAASLYLSSSYQHQLEPRVVRTTVKQAALRASADDGSVVNSKMIQQDQPQDTPPPSLPLSKTITNTTFNDTDNERNIVFVHVGKTGGMTFRNNMAERCQALNGTSQKVCYHRIPTHLKLARQTHHAVHIWSMNPEVVQNATSFVVSIRNPIDRVVSSWRYSHPDNCHNPIVLSKNDNKTRMVQVVLDKDGQPVTPAYGCEIVRRNMLQDPKHPAHLLYKTCFPTSPAMEEFAQATLQPWGEKVQKEPSLDTNTTTISNYSNVTSQQQAHYDYVTHNLTASKWARCRIYARQLLQGRHNAGINVHFQYNYAYYALHTFWKYPDKEVFVIRTEHEWDDMVNLDKQIGGSGNYSAEWNRKESHGSEKYHKQDLTTTAYHKLCCVLENELEIYLDIVKRAENLSDQDKSQAEEDLRQKCGIGPSWLQWKTLCHQQVQATEWHLQTAALKQPPPPKCTTPIPLSSPVTKTKAAFLSLTALPMQPNHAPVTKTKAASLSLTALPMQPNISTTTRTKSASKSLMVASMKSSQSPTNETKAASLSLTAKPMQSNTSSIVPPRAK